MLDQLRTWVSRLAAAMRMRRVQEDFARELDSHAAMLTEENVGRGMPPAEARRQAMLSLGNPVELREAHREQRGLPGLEILAQDSRYAWRMLCKYPGFTTVALLTLALGIGANTAMFSIVNAVLLKPLPYERPDRLFTVFQSKPQDRIARAGWSYPNLEEARQHNDSFDELAGSQHHQLMLSGRGEPVLLDTSVVTEGFFSVMGERALLGRTLNASDAVRGAAPVVVLSEGLWKSRFGADARIVGSAIHLDKRSFTVVGVMPASFRYPLNSDNEQLWIPLAQDPLFGGWMENRAGRWLLVVGRLKPGVSTSQAQAELSILSARLAKEFPADNGGWSAGMAPLREMIVGKEQTPLLVLLAAVGVVLLIACANIANLLLARATSRAREMSIRAMLGAGRGRLIRQLLIESAVLGLLGGAAGVLAAYWGVRGLTGLLPASLPQVHAIRVDFSVLGFALALTWAAVCVFGLAPTLLVARADPHPGLQGGGSRSGESRRQRIARNLLASAEIALAMILLVAAGLLLRSFARLTAVNPGFDPRHLVKAEMSLPRFQYSSPQQWLKFYHEVLPAIQSAPGLRDSAVALPPPIAYTSPIMPFEIVGSPASGSGKPRVADYVAISPEYFRIMGVPLLQGRNFSERDDAAAPRVAIISRALAQMYFPGEDPIGKQLRFGVLTEKETVHEIVGVAGDMRDVALGQPPGPMMFVPFVQSPYPGVVVVARTSLSISAVEQELRQQVGQFDKDLPISAVATMGEILDNSVAPARFRTLLLALFAAMSLLLAASGVFGVISYSVSCRTREIGIRMAVGASRTNICGMVARETMKLALAGVAAGIPLALAASRLIGHMLFDVSPGDPATLAAAAGGLVAVAIVAAYVPLRSAMRVDPVCALRHE